METVRVWNSAWNLDPFLLTALLVTAVLYMRGFNRLRVHVPEQFPTWRRDAFLLGLTVLFLALASPLDGLADLLLQAHMAQHWLLMMVVAPLIWLGAPAIPLLRGLPRETLTQGLGPLLSSPTLRRGGPLLTRPVVAWGIWAAIMLIWHWPRAYEAALVSRTWHDIEHASFLAGALLLWYPIIRPWPARHFASHGSRLLYIAATMVFNTFFSATFAFSGRVFYEAYTSVPRPWAISPLIDQNAAGAFMWIASSIPMLIAAVAVVIQWLSPDYKRPPPSVPIITSPPKPAWTGYASLRTRRVLQWALLGLAILIIIDGLWGTQSPSSENLAGVLPWTYWRGLSLISLLMIGNLFCAICPFTLSRKISARLLGQRWSWPSWLRNKWLAASLFVFYLWAYEVFALWDEPSWTAWLILGYFFFSFAVEGLFPRGTFCRFVCPIGQFNFVGSSLSPREVKVSSLAPCETCTTRDCLHGNVEQPGCPTGLFLPAKTGNNDCTFCMDCVRACPHDNISVQPVRPGHSIGEDRMAKRTPDLDWIALASVITFGAFINAAAMIEPVVRIQEYLAYQLGLNSTLVQTFWMVGGLTFLPMAILASCALSGQRLARVGLPQRVVLRKLAPGLIPIGLSMWMAHLGFHLITAYGSLIPATQNFFKPLLMGVWAGPLSAWPPLTADGVSLELFILGAGFLMTLGVSWRISLEIAPSTSRALRLAFPWVVTAFLLYLAGTWIVLQPMQMRGMVM